ncbi:MAG: hypothetical protein AB7N80_02625 [Bdellovibrionales bacterium]
MFQQADAITLSEDFSSNSRQDPPSTLVWNTVLGRLHPPLQVFQYSDGGLQNKNFSVGSGQHGAFEPSRYAEFSSGGDVSGNIIRLDTSVYQTLELTRFQLDAGWTLQPIGNQPLIVRVLGAVTIAGVIDCSGQNGEDQNGTPTVAPAGGAGRCSGGAGGAGGTTTANGGNGSNGGPQIPNGVGPGVDGPTAGVGATGTGSGGGGGGTYVPSRGVSDDSAAGLGATPGAAGFMVADNDFDYEGGGFGGGGGSHYNAGAPAQNSAGAGGGGGGGLIWFTAVGDIVIEGSVLADGGDGGTGTSLAGGGGGGAGGSIAMFAGGDVILSTATVSADGGVGGGPAGRLGGDGASGRTWLVGSSGYSTGGPPFEFPDPTVTDVGTVGYQTGSFTATSLENDIGNSGPTLTTVNTVSTLPGASTLTVEVATDSQTGFTPVWQATTALPLEVERLARFRVTLNNAVVATPAFLDTLTFEFDGVQANEFNFVSACGAVKTPRDLRFNDKLFWLVFFLLPLWSYLQLRSPSRR